MSNDFISVLFVDIPCCCSAKSGVEQTDHGPSTVSRFEDLPRHCTWRFSTPSSVDKCASELLRPRRGGVCFSAPPSLFFSRFGSFPYSQLPAHCPPPSMPCLTDASVLLERIILTWFVSLSFPPMRKRTGTGDKTVTFLGSHLDVVPANPETWEVCSVIVGVGCVAGGVLCVLP